MPRKLPPALPEGWRYVPFGRRQRASIWQAFDPEGKRWAMKQFDELPDVRTYYRALHRYYPERDGQRGFRVPQPLMRWRDSVVLEWIAAPRASDLLLARPYGARRRQIIARSGAWLSWFHHAQPIETGHYSAEMLLAPLRRLAEKCADPFVTQAIAQLEQWLVDGLMLDQASLHGDFTPNNLFIDAGETVGFDFVSDMQGPVLFDVCRYLTYMAVYRVWPVAAHDLRGQGCSRADQACFAEAYGALLQAVPARTFFLMQALEVVRRYASLQASWQRGLFSGWRRRLEYKRLRCMVRCIMQASVAVD